jgi:sugar lactone lactonase YvrE
MFKNLLALVPLSGLCVAIFCWQAGGANAAANETKVHPPVVLPGPPAKFDWMAYDKGRDRLIAAHRDAGTAEVLDLKNDKLIASIKTGAAQGVAVGDDDKYYFGDSKEEKIVVVDAKTFKVTGELKVPGEVDAIAFVSRTHRLYADHDDGTEVWVIDTADLKLVGTIEVGTGPEFVEYDPTTDKLYQNVKSTNKVAVISPDLNKVENSWSTLPAESPHGLAIDAKAGRLYSAGRNGKLVIIDTKTGKMIASVDIAKGVDQIAFDPEKKRICCACAGFVSVVEPTEEGGKLLENIPVHKGAHTLAIATNTHDAWVSYCDDNHSYLQRIDLP